MSHPTWVRGLKLLGILQTTTRTSRTLRGCVDWNRARWTPTRTMQVAPYVGAWIETSLEQNINKETKSHPTWVRGLKLVRCRLCRPPCLSHPTWVRGLKLKETYLFPLYTCRTLRGCVDWNQNRYLEYKTGIESHPTWVRGLKHRFGRGFRLGLGRTLRGCVDWNKFAAFVSLVACVAPYVGAWIET